MGAVFFEGGAAAFAFGLFGLMPPREFGCVGLVAVAADEGGDEGGKDGGNQGCCGGEDDEEAFEAHGIGSGWGGSEAVPASTPAEHKRGDDVSAKAVLAQSETGNAVCRKMPLPLFV